MPDSPRPTNDKPHEAKSPPPASGTPEGIRASMRRTAELQRATAQVIREQSRKGVFGYRVKVF